MTSVVHLKLTQIQHDMLSFDIPKREIKQVMKKFLKQSKIIPNLMARDIMMRMQMEDQSQQSLTQKRLVVDDQLFNNDFQAVNRDQRSTLFGVNKDRNAIAFDLKEPSFGAKSLPQNGLNPLKLPSVGLAD